jgi:acetyl esterase/lipase
VTAREDVRRALAHLQAIAPGPADDTIEKILATVRRAMTVYGDATARPPLEGVAAIPCDADGVPCEWIVPQAAIEDERIVHCHGGSLIAGSFDSHRPMLSVLARAARRPVLSVGYRLAPEYPYPTAHQDCQKAFAWAAAHGPRERSPARRLALSGDSSGAALAMATCADAITNHKRTPDCMVLIGAVALAGSVAERPDRDSDKLINNAAMQAIALYAGQTPLDDPNLSSLNHDDAVLSCFPPVLLQVGAPEFLLFDSVALANRLARLNRRAVLSVWPDMPHVWHHFTTHLPEAEMAVAEAAQFIDESCEGLADHES